MEFPELQTLIFDSLIFILGIITGRFLGKRKSRNRSSVLRSSENEDILLKNELLEDEVKQLNSKIKTLEKALELSQ